MHFLCIMGHLNYKELGEGQAVVILHGLLGMLDNWQTFSKALSASYKVYSVDQRNHGRSFHSPEFNYKILAEDLVTFLDELELKQVYLIGHSMGGKAVMQFMMDYPQRTKKAVIVDITPRGTTGSHESIFEALLSLDLKKVQSRKEVQQQLTEFGFELSTILLLMKNLSRQKEGGYVWKANIQGLYDNYKNIVAGVSSDQVIEDEILFVKGSRSQYIRDEDKLEIESLFPNFQIEEIKDAGHWIHTDKPENLLSLVNHFFNPDKTTKI